MDMKSGKSFIAGMVSMLLIVGLVGTAAATTGKVTRELEYRDITVTLDGQKLDLRDAQGRAVEPFMFDGTNYLPVRALAESLGLEVSWDGSTNTVVLTTPDEDAQESSGAETSQLLFSKDHVRYYYTGYQANTDGSYGFHFRIENDSDYTFRFMTRDFAVNGLSVKTDFACTVEPGAEAECTATVTAEALADAEITEVRRISTVFVAIEDVTDRAPIQTNTGVARITLE